MLSFLVFTLAAYEKDRACLKKIVYDITIFAGSFTLTFWISNNVL